MIAIISALRDGCWLTRSRMTLWATACLAATLAFILFLAATAHGLSDYSGRPLGTDFSSFYSAGRAALAGSSPYDQDLLYKTQETIFGPHTPYYAFAYPPVFLLVAKLLAALPYPAALALWQIGSFALYLWAMIQLMRHFAPSLPNAQYCLLAAAYSAVFVNLTHGQNGFLSAALFALALASLDAAPWLAGFVFGLVAFKPQLGLLIPFALAAGGHWRSMAGAAITALAAAALATFCFGPDIWRAFFSAASLSRHEILDLGEVGYEKMISVFAWARLWHAPLLLAYLAQAAAALAVILETIRLWRSGADPRLKGAALCLGTLLVTPFAVDYDLMLLAPAIALLAAHGLEKRFAHFEASLLALLWLMPLLARGIANSVFLPLGVWCTGAGYWFAAMRARVS